MERTNYIKWKKYLKDLSQAVSAIKFNNDASIIIMIMENAPLTFYFFSAFDGSFLGGKQQSHPSYDREPRVCKGDCVFFSFHQTNSFYLALSTTFLSSIKLDPFYCC